MTPSIYFDDSLPAFASLVQQEWGELALAENIFLRDVTGQLTFIVLSDKYNLDQRSTLAAKARAKLGVYVDGNGFAVATADELFDDRLKDIAKARKHHLDSAIFSGDALLVDRRMVGADWLRDISPTAKPPLRIVFSSIKGGVGRSTALCVLAAHLASQGRRVLAIDMDIEAPGLGNMLLPEGTLPTFGLLDYLVERGLGIIEDQFYVDMVGSSWLGGGRGRVDVVPAIGQRSLENPANVLSKIARAYLDGGELNEEPISFMDHMKGLVDYLADSLRYDVVLIDARAGLHETTATAVVGLGAEVLFFGLDQPQTFAGYELLFSHLGEFQSDTTDDWRNRMHFVHSKAPGNISLRNKFSQDMRALVQKYLWPLSPKADIQIDVESLKSSFEVDWIDDSDVAVLSLSEDDSQLPIYTILNDNRFNSFDPLSDRGSLVEQVYSATYGDFLQSVTTMVDSSMTVGQK